MSMREGDEGGGRDAGLCGEAGLVAGSPGPGQQIVDLPGGIGCDPGDDVAQIGFGIEAVELGGLCRPPNYAEWVCFPQHSS
jgi:hypothetical protein